jgi:hypothetical protein
MDYFSIGEEEDANSLDTTATKRKLHPAFTPSQVPKYQAGKGAVLYPDQMYECRKFKEPSFLRKLFNRGLASWVPRLLYFEDEFLYVGVSNGH